MATFARLEWGCWRAQVRRKGRYAADTFLRRRDAETWALEVERGDAVKSKSVSAGNGYASEGSIATLLVRSKPLATSASALAIALA
ncbi:MAG: hypothetical protein ACK4TP_11760 [Hyphomicrobium sp.]